MAFGRKAALRKVHSAMTMVRFFSFFAPQMALPKKTGGEVLGVPMSIGKHRRGRPGKAGVDYQGHTGRRVQRRGAAAQHRMPEANSEMLSGITVCLGSASSQPW